MPAKAPARRVVRPPSVRVVGGWARSPVVPPSPRCCRPPPGPAHRVGADAAHPHGCTAGPERPGRRFPDGSATPRVWHHPPIEHPQPVHQRLTQARPARRVRVVDAVQTRQRRGQHARTGAVTGVHQPVLGQQAHHRGVRGADRHRRAQHEHVPTAHPQPVERGQHLPHLGRRGTGVLTQVQLRRAQAQRGQRADLPSHLLPAHVHRVGVHRVRDHRHAGIPASEANQMLRVGAQPKRRQVQPHAPMVPSASAGVGSTYVPLEGA